MTDHDRINWHPYPSFPPLLAYHAHSIPYLPHSNSLQTLDLYIPTLHFPRSSTGIFILYIHGGAWRDPLITSSSFASTTHTLLTSSTPDIAGIASINYSLSPYPTHPTHPSSPDDPARNAVHPTHLNDVRAAIAWLRRVCGMTKYLLAGHSAGATIALQSVMDCEDEGPEGVLGVNGIYDLEGLVTWREEYKELVEGAFGGVEGWKRASPNGGWNEQMMSTRGMVMGSEGIYSSFDVHGSEMIQRQSQGRDLRDLQTQPGQACSLAEYQMYTMLFEQQEKRRRMQARREQANDRFKPDGSRLRISAGQSAQGLSSHGSRNDNVLGNEQIGRTASTWGDGKVVVLGQSRDDSLLNDEQTEGMLRVLRDVKGLKVLKAEITGDHDDIWKQGVELARMVLGLVKMVMEKV